MAVTSGHLSAMRLLSCCLVWIVSANVILGLPLQQRTGRLGHVIQNRKEATVARHRTQTHLQQNQNTGTRNRHHVLHGQHAAASGAHAHFHGGHSHEALLAQYASLRRGLHHNHTGHGHKLRYHVPSHKHFAAKRTKRPIKQRGTNGSRKGKTLGGMALDLSALMIDKDLLKDPGLPGLTNRPTSRTATTKAPRPSPSRWKMKNTVQVSDTRSFDTMFRKAVSSRKVPIRVKPSVSIEETVKTGANAVNANKVIRYVDSVPKNVGSKSISKRGIGRIGNTLPRMAAQTDNGAFKNKLTIRLWNETKKGNVAKTDPKVTVSRISQKTRTTRKRVSVTSAPQFTQGRFGKIITKQTRPMVVATTSAPYRPPATTKVEYTLQTTGTTYKPNVNASDMVQLEGIHVMFADGKQKKNDKVPTLHLTAALTDKATTTIKKDKQALADMSKNQSLLNNLQTIINKIVGTAIIKNGHLYLVVYPFGNKKSVDVRFPNERSFNVDNVVATTPNPKRTQLPTNKPVPIPGMESQTPRPSTWKATVPTTTTPSPTTRTTTTTTRPTFTTTMSFSSLDHLMHGHVHGHMDMKGSMDHGDMAMGMDMSNMGTKPSNHDPLGPIPRFISPWKSVNLSSIFPHPTNVTLIDDDDKDIKVLPFVAQASDPFEKIKMILAALANKTENATMSSSNVNDSSIDPSADASFNFELQIKEDILTTHGDKKETTTASENTSEEKSTTYTPRLDITRAAVTQPSITNDGNTDKYVTRIKTIQSTKIDPTVGPMHHITSRPIDDVRKLEPEPKAVIATPLQRGTSTDREVPSKMNFGRVSDIGKGLADTYVEPYIGSRLETNVPMRTQKDGAFLTQTARQLHEEENLVRTKLPFRHPSMSRPTTQSPTVATPPKRTSGSHEGFANPITKVTISPGQHPPQVLPVMHRTLPQGPRILGTMPGDSRAAANVDAFKEDRSRVKQAVVSPLLSPPRKTVPAQKQEKPVGKTTFPTHNLNRGQTEQIISLADVLTDIRKIQLHNMQRFNIQNNNFNTMLLSNADKSSSRRSPVFNKYPRIPSNQRSGFLSPATTQSVPSNTMSWRGRPNNGRNAMRDAIDAMLVLSVDDIVADHTNLHGALVLSQPRDSSAGSSSSNK